MKKKHKNNTESQEQIRPKPKHYEFEELEEIVNAWARERVAQTQHNEVVDASSS